MTIAKWRMCCGYPVWVEDGRVTRGLSKDGLTAVHPYRSIPARRGGGWERVERVELNTLRSGLYNGRWRMM